MRKATGHPVTCHTDSQLHLIQQVEMLQGLLRDPVNFVHPSETATSLKFSEVRSMLSREFPIFYNLN